ncbi:LysR family transcriptional regulator [Pseudomonas syringae]|uniref:LysR family transcriptional regulator n=1 Tax=Pseudomonas syringae TaxID=317 RepID=UPI001F1591A6|nr:LysR family transcriptional regulator [Pseudomonas syringae]MCF5722812.1 LysR family transcriptional regulator [Pseudomonas syringae]
MRYNHLDLNLLVALDVLLEEGNITRAAARLHMSQSATSGVLARLRKYFDDELLVQVGRRMQPTPFAIELSKPVREALLIIRSSISQKPIFEPEQSKRHFRIVASDYLITVLFTQVIQMIHQQAPGITFELLAPGDNSGDMLTNGEVDFWIVPEHYIIPGHPSKLLFEEEHVCVIWEENSQISETLTLEKYMEMGHVSVGFGRSRMLSIEEWFVNQYGFKRRIEVITNDFNTLPQLIVGTDRIATAHRRLAEWYARYLPLRVLPTPVKIPLMQEHILWHRSMDGDPMHRWLRERITEFIQSVDSKPHAPVIQLRDRQYPN